MIDNLISRAGRALYGESWRHTLADDLGVSYDSVRRWSNGKPIPPGVWADIYGLLVERLDDVLHAVLEVRDER